MKSIRPIILMYCLLSLLTAMAQEPAISRVDPPFWWIGMQEKKVELMVYGKRASAFKASINYPGVRLVQSSTVENPNYLFLELEISAEAKPDTVPVIFEYNGQQIRLEYQLLPPVKDPSAAQGLSPKDFIYLIMPDRFADGDPSNNTIKGMRDSVSDRKSPYLRHGGDFKGILDHMDYYKELGVTALWLNPVTVNDGAPVKELHGNLQAAYHGYHFTDFYTIDPRFGGTEGYRKLVSELHKNGIKIIQDAVYNHVGQSHVFYTDPPTTDWINTWPTYTQTSHKDQSLADPHAAAGDQKVLSDGWFTSFLPDLNQRSPHLATYLIQNAIWQTAYFGLDAWRIDTYKYNDLEFMNRCNAALVREFPRITLFGESWVTNPAGMSYYVQNNLDLDFACNLESTVDFPSYSAILSALNESYGWDEGVSRLYQTLSQDFLYKHPEKLVTFLDNHDTDRFYSVIKEDFRKYKMGIGWLMTSRGIPQIYYGTEILMKNFKNPTDAEVRKDFPGGFPGDKVNKFTAAGRVAQEQEAFTYVKTLAAYRKNSSAISSGKFMHYTPQEGIYVYFRYDEKQTVMVIMNQNETEKNLETARFSERMAGFSKAKNIVSGEALSSLKSLKCPAMSVT
ncbi:MAG: alpha-amylase, partial [Bacteroidetes bacterium]